MKQIMKKINNIYKLKNKQNKIVKIRKIKKKKI